MERRFLFTRRVQISDKSVDSFASGLREIAAKCQFLPAELQSRLVDQFINGVTDRSLQCKLLQEPPGSLDEAILIARRYEAAKSAQLTIQENQKLIQSVNSVQQINTNNRICFTCKRQGHTSRDCPNKQGRRGSFTQPAPLYGRGQPPKCYLCNRVGHIARFFPEKQQGSYQNNSQRNNNPKQFFQPQFGYNYDNASSQASHRQPSVTPKICYACGQPGHTKRDCFYVQQQSVYRLIMPPVQPQQLAPPQWMPQPQQVVRMPGETPIAQHDAQNQNITLSSIMPDANRNMIFASFNINQRNILCMIDTGSPINLISRTVLHSLPFKGTIEPSDIVAHAANASPMSLSGKVKLEFNINDTIHYLNF